MIDRDPVHGDVARWWAESSDRDEPPPEDCAPFWRAQGFAVHRVMTDWNFESRADFEAVMRIELPPELAARVIATWPAQRCSAGFCLYHWHKPRLMGG